MLLIVLAIVFFIYRSAGLSGLLQAAWAAVGLGFVIFIHELGHFLAAKWCDVHVTAFSLGFGPALPGCSYTHGETTYKIAVLPLGGYVAMVGEGTEADEDENYPRSFKNKTVLQRMLIISAGVIMNILFGILCLMCVYRYLGVDRPAAGIWRVDAGSVAWQEGVRAGWRIDRIDSKEKPFFEDLLFAVAFSSANTPIQFVFRDSAGSAHELALLPSREGGRAMPAIGVSPSVRLALSPGKRRQPGDSPVTPGGAAWRARVLPLADGDTIQGHDWDSLARAFTASSEPITLEVVRKGGRVEKVVAQPAGFDFGDEIVGMTDPETPDRPFNVTPLREDPFRPGSGRKDPMQYRIRQVRLLGKPIVYQVKRVREEEEKKTESSALVFVPPAYVRDFGLRMKMGKVAAVRKGSSAEKAGLKPGDVISAAGVAPPVRVSASDLFTGPIEAVSRILSRSRPDFIPVEKFDPVRLPDHLFTAIHSTAPSLIGKPRVVLKVLRPVKAADLPKSGHKNEVEVELPPMDWDDSWHPGDEAPFGGASPMSVPQIGAAYWVESTVASVAPGSPAEKAGLRAGDRIEEARYRGPAENGGEAPWSRWSRMVTKRGWEEAYDQWAHHFDAVQRNGYVEAEFRIMREGKVVPSEEGPKSLWERLSSWLPWSSGPPGKAFGPVAAIPDESWPMPERGIPLMPDSDKQKADSLAQAAGMGLDRTLSFIKQIYLNLRSMIVGRISATSLGGPIEIAKQAFTMAGLGPLELLMFLGIISINLAVVNFLPIPILDGGHMVFLIWEGLTGRRPSEMVQMAASILGLVLILSLMVFVFYLDIGRL
jgi:regulator of sigma E protease